jgi:anti-sigma factor RsiW
MTCRDVASFLMNYLDGELAEEPRRVFDEHLAECPDCVRYIERYREAIRLAKAAVVDDAECDAPESLVTAILAARRKGS